MYALGLEESGQDFAPVLSAVWRRAPASDALASSRDLYVSLPLTTAPTASVSRFPDAAEVPEAAAESLSRSLTVVAACWVKPALAGIWTPYHGRPCRGAVNRGAHGCASPGPDRERGR